MREHERTQPASQSEGPSARIPEVVTNTPIETAALEIGGEEFVVLLRRKAEVAIEIAIDKHKTKMLDWLKATL